MLYLALGILGATVMPHNLYLHTAIVQTRAYGETVPEKREAIRFATLDSTIALLFALMINASILILAAASFHARGQTDVEDLGQAHSLLVAAARRGSRAVALRDRAPLLRPLLHGDRDDGRPGGDGRLSAASAWRPGSAASSPAASPSCRRPASPSSPARAGAAKLLIFSQVVLSLQLSFAVVPLVMFTAEPRQDGRLRLAALADTVAVLIAAVIVILNLKLVADFVLAAF